MKRLLIVGLVALGLAAAARPVKADCMFDYSVCRHFNYVHTGKSRCFSFSSHPNPLPCVSSHGYSGPAPWDSLAAYGAPPYAAPVATAPAVAAPATTTPAPAATTPSFTPPPPKATGVQQAGYFYYGQTANPAASSGYNYGGYLYYGQGAGYYQAPNYWYDN